MTLFGGGPAQPQSLKDKAMAFANRWNAEIRAQVH